MYQRFPVFLVVFLLVLASFVAATNTQDYEFRGADVCTGRFENQQQFILSYFYKDHINLGSVDRTVDTTFHNRILSGPFSLFDTGDEDVPYFPIDDYENNYYSWSDDGITVQGGSLRAKLDQQRCLDVTSLELGTAFEIKSDDRASTIAFLPFYVSETFTDNVELRYDCGKLGDSGGDTYCAFFSGIVKVWEEGENVPANFGEANPSFIPETLIYVEDEKTQSSSGNRWSEVTRSFDSDVTLQPGFYLFVIAHEHDRKDGDRRANDKKHATRVWLNKFFNMDNIVVNTAFEGENWRAVNRILKPIEVVEEFGETVYMNSYCDGFSTAGGQSIYSGDSDQLTVAEMCCGDGLEGGYWRTSGGSTSYIGYTDQDKNYVSPDGYLCQYNEETNEYLGWTEFRAVCEAEGGATNPAFTEGLDYDSYGIQDGCCGNNPPSCQALFDCSDVIDQDTCEAEESCWWLGVSNSCLSRCGLAAFDEEACNNLDYCRWGRDLGGVSDDGRFLCAQNYDGSSQTLAQEDYHIWDGAATSQAYSIQVVDTHPLGFGTYIDFASNSEDWYVCGDGGYAPGANQLNPDSTLPIADSASSATCIGALSYIEVALQEEFGLDSTPQFDDCSEDGDGYCCQSDGGEPLELGEEGLLGGVGSNTCENVNPGCFMGETESGNPKSLSSFIADFPGGYDAWVAFVCDAGYFDVNCPDYIANNPLDDGTFDGGSDGGTIGSGTTGQYDCDHDMQDCLNEPPTELIECIGQTDAGDNRVICEGENTYCTSGVTVPFQEATENQVCCIMPAEEDIAQACGVIEDLDTQTQCEDGTGNDWFEASLGNINDFVCPGTANGECCVGGDWEPKFSGNLYNSIPDNERFICYEQNNIGRFAECCSDFSCYNGVHLGQPSPYTTTEQLGSYVYYGLGGVLHTVINFDEYVGSNLVNYHYEQNVPRGEVMNIFLKIDSVHANTNWIDYDTLHFEFLSNVLNPVENIILVSGAGDTCTIATTKFFNDEQKPYRWHKVATSLNTCRDNFDLTDVVRIQLQTKSTLENGATSALLVVDNFYLTDSDNSGNSNNQYCSGPFKQWVEDLDPPEDIDLSDFTQTGPYQYACNAWHSMEWSGTQCCGNGASNKESYTDTQSGCFQGTIVRDGWILGEDSLNNPEYNNILFYNDGVEAAFYGCVYVDNVAEDLDIPSDNILGNGENIGIYECRQDGRGTPGYWVRSERLKCELFENDYLDPTGFIDNGLYNSENLCCGDHSDDEGFINGDQICGYDVELDDLTWQVTYLDHDFDEGEGDETSYCSRIDGISAPAPYQSTVEQPGCCGGREIHTCTVDGEESYVCDTYDAVVACLDQSDCEVNWDQLSSPDIGALILDNSFACSRDVIGETNQIVPVSYDANFIWWDAQIDAYQTHAFETIDGGYQEFVSNGEQWFVCGQEGFVEGSTLPVSESQDVNSCLGRLNRLIRSNAFSELDLPDEGFVQCDGQTEFCCISNPSFEENDFFDSCDNSCYVNTDETFFTYRGTDDPSNTFSTDYCDLFPSDDFCEFATGGSDLTIGSDIPIMSDGYTYETNCVDVRVDDKRGLLCGEPYGTVCSSGEFVQVQDAVESGGTCCLVNDDGTVPRQQDHCELAPEILDAQTCLEESGSFLNREPTTNDYCTSGLSIGSCCIQGNWNIQYDNSLIALQGQDAQGFICHQFSDQKRVTQCCFDETSCGNYFDNGLFGPLDPQNNGYVGVGASTNSLETFDSFNEQGLLVNGYGRLVDVSTINPLSINLNGADLRNSNDWTLYEYLLFDVMFNTPVIGDVILVDGTGKTALFVVDLTTGSQTSTWQRASVDLNSPIVVADGFSIQNIVQMQLLPKSTFDGTVDVIIDNIHLYNSETDTTPNYYCSGPFVSWLSDLDGSTEADYDPTNFDDYAPYQYTCDAIGSFDWSGSQCCGDDALSKNNEYYADGWGGCFSGNYIPSNAVVGEVLTNSEFNDVLYYGGLFHNCVVNEEEPADVITSNDFYGDDGTIISENHEAYDIVGGYVCDITGNWLDIRDVSKRKILAAKLFEVAQTAPQYEIFCDDVDRATPFLFSKENPNSALLEEQIEDFCVLSHYQELDGDERVLLGLNFVSVTVEEFLTTLGSHLVLQEVIEADDVAEFSSVCSSSTSSSEDDFFVMCEAFDDLRVRYNDEYNILLLAQVVDDADDFNGFMEVDTEQSFAGNLWTNLLRSLQNIFTREDSIDYDNKLPEIFIEESFDLDAIYLSQYDDLTIHGLVQDDTILVEYGNFISSVEPLVYRYYDDENLNYILGVNRQVVTIISDEAQNNLYDFEPAFDWRRFSSGLRKEKQVGAPVTASLGSGVIDIGEDCDWIGSFDDGNFIYAVGDGSCGTWSEDYINAPTATNSVSCQDDGTVLLDTCYYCGDGEINNGESCDDGNSVDDDFCSNTCTLNS